MRIAYVTNGFPFPLTSGYLRHYNFIRRLSADHEIHLLSMISPDFTLAHQAEMDKFCSSIHTFAAQRGLRGRIASNVGRAAARLPGSKSGVERLGAELSKLVNGGEVDVVFFSGKRTFPALAGLSDVPLVVDICDATSSRLRQLIGSGGLGRIPKDILNFADTHFVEQRLAKRADRLLFASERDRNLVMKGDDDSRAMVVPNGVDIEFWQRTSPTLGTGAIAFTGKMDYEPNEEGAIRLVTEIAPKVWETHPRTRVLLIGRDPTPRLRAMSEKDERVVVTGFVDDVRPHLEEAAVFVAPLRHASGIQNKLLEALAMAMPTVASSVAAAGLQLDGDASSVMRVSDDNHELANFVTSELDAAVADPSPNHASRDWVSKRFSWDASTDLVSEALEASAGLDQPA